MSRARCPSCQRLPGSLSSVSASPGVTVFPVSVSRGRCPPCHVSRGRWPPCQRLPGSLSCVQASPGIAGLRVSVSRGSWPPYRHLAALRRRCGRPHASDATSATSGRRSIASRSTTTTSSPPRTSQVVNTCIPAEIFTRTFTLDLQSSTYQLSSKHAHCNGSIYTNIHFGPLVQRKYSHEHSFWISSRRRASQVLNTCIPAEIFTQTFTLDLQSSTDQPSGDSVDGGCPLSPGGGGAKSVDSSDHALRCGPSSALRRFLSYQLSSHSSSRSFRCRHDRSRDYRSATRVPSLSKRQLSGRKCAENYNK